MTGHGAIIILLWLDRERERERERKRESSRIKTLLETALQEKRLLGRALRLGGGRF